MEDFKRIADEAMSGITVSEELKRKTLERCIRRKAVPLSKFLVPAACFLLILCVVNFSGILQKNPFIDGNESTQPEGIITAHSSENAENFSLQNDDMTVDLFAEKEREIKTLEEARDSFGDAFLTPSYVPENYKLAYIRASGPDENTADRVVLNYSDGNRSFSVIQEKVSMQQELTGFKTVDINGIAGYLRALPVDAGENKDVPGAEIHWFKEGVHYSITGSLTEDEAIRIASSMEN